MGGRALDGSTVAITRAPKDAGEFCEMVRARGGVPLALPTIRLVPRGTDAAKEFVKSVRDAHPDYAVFLSSRAASVLFESAQKAGIESELSAALSSANIVAVGPKTKKALEERGVRVSHTPKTHSSVGVGELFSTLYRPDARRVIIPRSAASNEFLRDLLEKIGLEVTESYLYDVQPDGQGGDWEKFRAMAADSCVDAIIFTSASSVRAFIEIVGAKGVPSNAKLVAIGPFTSIEMEHAGLDHAVASVHTVGGALDEIMGS